MLRGGQIEIEEPHERVEIFRLAIHLLVGARNVSASGSEAGYVAASRSICAESSPSFRPARIQSFVCASRAGAFCIFAGADVGACELEKFFESAPDSVCSRPRRASRARSRSPGAQKAFAEESEERGVLFIGSKGLEKRDRAFGITFAKLGFCEKQRAGAVVGQKPVGPAEILQRFVQAAAGLRQLSCAEEATRGKIGVTQLLGEFAKDDVPRGIFRVEERHAFVARQRFDIALLLRGKVRRQRRTVRWLL